MAETDTASAAAALALDIMQEAARNGDENAARVLMSEGQPDAAPQVVASSPAPAAETAEAPLDPFLGRTIVETPDSDVGEAVDPADIPDFAPQLSDELAAMLEEGDWEEEAAAEVASMIESGELDENSDPDLVRQMKALEKRNQFLEQRVVETNRGKWVQENLRAYPLLAQYAPEVIQEIQSTSRRGFAREAQKANERYAKMLKPALDDLAAIKASAKAEAVAEGRQQAAVQWGLPVAEPAGSGVPADNAALAQARANREPLHKRIKIMLNEATKA